MHKNSIHIFVYLNPYRTLLLIEDFFKNDHLLLVILGCMAHDSRINRITGHMKHLELSFLVKIHKDCAKLSEISKTLEKFTMLLGAIHPRMTIHE